MTTETAPQNNNNNVQFVLPDGYNTPEQPYDSANANIIASDNSDTADLKTTPSKETSPDAEKHPATPVAPRRPIPHKDQLIPELREKYTPIAILGRGTQGTVFLAQSIQTGQKVAIKQLNIDSVTAWKTYDLFQREVDTLSKLDMPGIARFYEAAEHLSGDHPGACIVQEFIEGRTLAEMMKSGHCFSLSRIFELALQIINILDKLHHHNPPIIHRDIKPSNLILTPSDTGFTVTLIDFGAVANPQIQSGGSTVAGTFGFMPPEQITGNPGPESDIYALGVLLVSLISGVDPADMQIKDFRLIIDPLLENVPPQVVPVLRQMTDPLVQSRLTDHEKIKQIFSAFAHDQYNIPSLAPITSMSETEFAEKLAKVEYVGQPENINLWQQLSETVPRQIPPNYSHPKIRTIPEIRSPILLRKLIASSLGTFICCLAAPSLLFFLFAGFSFFSVWLNLLFIALHIAYFVLFTNCKSVESNRKRLFEYYEARSESSDITHSQYTELLEYGRRSMATVISIEQENLSAKSFKHMRSFLYVASEPPAFKIKYKFNPPDDDNPDDLIRTYIASRPPKIHPGDPIPILYLIKDDDKSKKRKKNKPKSVVAMPFPFPFKDYSSFDRIVSIKE